VKESAGMWRRETPVTVLVFARICVCPYLCLPVSVFARICVCPYLCLPVSVFARICVCPYLCLPVSVFARVGVCFYCHKLVSCIAITRDITLADRYATTCLHYRHTVVLSSSTLPSALLSLSCLYLVLIPVLVWSSSLSCPCRGDQLLARRTHLLPHTTLAVTRCARRLPHCASALAHRIRTLPHSTTVFTRFGLAAVPSLVPGVSSSSPFTHVISWHWQPSS